MSIIYNWSDELEEYLNSKNIEVYDVSLDEIPTKLEDNKIYFNICSDDRDNKAVAFFRHLRNAFTHYNIGYDGENFCMKDFTGSTKNSKLSMIGKIEKSLFYGIMEIFFNQKSEIERQWNTN